MTKYVIKDILVEKCHTSPFVSKLLKYLEIDAEELSKSIAIPEPSNYLRIEEVAEVVERHIKNKSKILIYGDYDVDGIFSTSIIYRYLSEYLDNVSYYLPSRQFDGYGLNLKYLERLDSQIDLLILVDNGIALDRSIFVELKKRGIECIILDHHISELTNLDDILFLHPTYSNYSDLNMSATTVVYNLVRYLRKKDDYFDYALAGISLVSDNMELVSYNRSMVKYALNILNSKMLPFLRLLNDNKTFTLDSLAYTIIPRLNSISRTNNDALLNEIVKYIYSFDSFAIVRIKDEICKCNDLRRNTTKILTEEAKKIQYDKDSLFNAIILKDSTTGYNGLIASSLSATTNKGFVVLSVKENHLEGSVRSPFDISKIFTLDYVTGGGHKFAGGVTILKEDYLRFNRDLKELYKDEIIVHEKECVLLTVDDFNSRSIKEYQDLLPLPLAKEVLFCIKGISKNLINFSKNGKSFYGSLGPYLKFICFDYELLNITDKMSLIGSISINVYNNIESLQLIVTDTI